MEHSIKPVTFDPDAFRAWLAEEDENGNRRLDMIPDRIKHNDHEFDPAKMVEVVLDPLSQGRFPKVWRYAPDVLDVDTWRTGDNEGVDGGCLPDVEMSSGVTLSCRHLPDDDLVYGVPKAGITGIEAAVMALHAVAGEVNDAVVKYRAALGSAVGREVWVLTWDCGIEEPTEVYVRATYEGADGLRDKLIRAHWDSLIACYPEAPEDAPEDPEEALEVWEATNEEHADPRVGVFSIDSVTVAS